MKFYLFLLNIGVCFLNSYYVNGTHTSVESGNLEEPDSDVVDIILSEKDTEENKSSDICDLPCQNGGVCIPPGMCECPQEFTGPLCQHPNPIEIDDDFYPVEGDVDKPSFEANETFIGTTEFFDVSKKPHVVLERKPQPGSCFSWGGSHFKTFDRDVFSFNSPCAHILVRDAVDNTFTIITQNSRECFLEKSGNCHTIIRVFLEQKEYKLDYSDDGRPVLLSENKTLPIPGRFKEVRTEVSANFIIILLDLVGVKIKWDGEQLVQLEVEESLWNKTAGLCGRFDGDITNDILAKDETIPKNIITLASSWQADSLGATCKDIPTDVHSCKDTKVKGSKGHNAVEFCKQVLFDKRFSLCQTIMDIRLLMDACLWDYCSCKYSNPERCACETLNVYVRECTHKGITSLTKWRDNQVCPMHCTGGKVYMPCAPTGGQTICGDVSEKLEEETDCEEGCYCPEGTYLHDSKCITKESCPCKYHGKEYSSGSTIPDDCNTCTCSDGKWICTEITCVKRCSVIGDPHYITFDGKAYDFMGKCTYYLVKHENFTVEMENIACGGANSQTGNVDDSSPSCPRSAIVRISGQTIKIKQGHEVSINGLEVTQIPVSFVGVNIRMASSMFLVVELPNGLQVWWDGTTRAYVDLPPTFIGETKGLCGTFNKNQKDDFLTPEGDIEQTVAAFANKWKTSETCGDISETANAHPCDVNIQNKAAAEEHCRVMKSKLFADCFSDVDPETFYANCMYDVCACNTQTSKCLCPMIASYAEECAKKGINIYWRNEIRQCGVQCPSGQTYQICGNSCTRSCYDIATMKECQRQCVEGCNCPEGETLDENGECIPIGQCDCHHNGLDFRPGYKEIRTIGSEKQLCTCFNGRWECKLATNEEVKDYPPASDSRDACEAAENKEFTTCEPIEPKTCKNMHSYEPVSSAVCHAGCQCKFGYVLDTSTQICMKPSECSCHHGGKSYAENSTVQSDCNSCICKDASWECTKKPCPGECVAWGDSHYKTFDGKAFDFQGQCDYMLVKGTMGNDNSFDISIQNVPCSSLGVSCSKSITIKVGNMANREHLTLTQGREIPQHAILKQLNMRQKDHYVIVEAPELGIIVRWDKGTRVYVKLNTAWKDKVKGLCGNYNDDELDDFQTPSGGISEVSAQLFGDSWRLQPYCPESVDITNTCEQRPERKVWALKQCGILKSSVFSNCHAEVPFELYFERCVFDTCACDQGGDCDCLCTALAAYAQECNTKGVPIKWRTPDLCPMQCDERCAQYSPCISSCPIETCDNILIRESLTKMCKQDTCIEGCQVKLCPPNFVYSNSSLLECIPKGACKPFCLEIDGKKYFEGDLIEEDACHTCYCSRGKKNCQGQPCLSTRKPLITPSHEPVICKPGWTEWINQNIQPINKTEAFDDIEPLPGSLVLYSLKGESRCEIKDMVDIECRTVKGHLSPKETGLNVECSLEHGLVCASNKEEGSCVDFELRVKCLCEGRTTPSLITPTPESCDILFPFMENPVDCGSYIFCEETANGPRLTIKPCDGDKLFNPITLECNLPEAVLELKPQCKEVEVTTEEGEKEAVKCPPGEQYHSCFINCNRLCMYYSYVIKLDGYCLRENECEKGCVSIYKPQSCPEGMFWANNETCVAKQDCMCISYAGIPVKPGGVVKESDCETCQCIDNYYSCDTSPCLKPSVATELPTEVTQTYSTPFFSVSTVTPPLECKEEDFIDLIDGEIPLSDEAFSASSTASRNSVPKYSRLNSTVSGESDGSWIPRHVDKDQYLQIDLGRQEPIYGVVLKGSPLHDDYVTSYIVSYSTDGYSFNYITDYKKQPQIFRGSFDANSPVKQLFDVPIEAQVIRINPQTWHNGIALRVELIGCKTLKTTIITTVRPPSPLCIDDMGFDNGMMADQQISVSSELKPEHTKEKLKSSNRHGWQPITNSPTEWVQFDFLQPRNITGFISRGGPDGWVTAFSVKYSHDGKDWNPILNEDRTEHVFPGNIDKNTPHTTSFALPIQTRLLRIIPLKWQDNIQLRIEPQGCFIPYRVTQVTSTTTTEIPIEECNNCADVPVDSDLCHCEGNHWWNGTSCVLQAECPCSFRHILYPIGSVFIKEDCSKCICTLGGSSRCTPIVCNKCENEELRSVLTKSCNCECQPCDIGTRICPSTNICIDETAWCNGVKDCPDDETGCVVTTLPTTTTTTTTKKPHVECPEPICPPGYKVIFKHPKKSESLNTMFDLNTKKGGVKGSHHKHFSKGGVKEGHKVPNKPTPPTIIEQTPSTIPEESLTEDECPTFECIFIPPHPGSTPSPCPETVCPPGYVRKKDNEDKEIENCPKYYCAPVPPPDAICNVTGQTFNTFDYTEYKYDICNHILVRDLVNDNWEVILQKNCTKLCRRSIVIYLMEHVFVLHPDLSIEYNGYNYTVELTRKIGSYSRLFAIAQLGDTLLFVSNKYGFWVIWDNQENVKVGVTRKLLEKVDGLCGYFNDDSIDDKRKPDETLAKTTAEFGASWLQADQSLVCEAQICPMYLQKKAQEMCNSVREQAFAPCTEAVNIDAFISRCVETTCKCLEAVANVKEAEEKCRCSALQNFVVDCSTADSNAEVIDWRMKYDCPVTCESPLVHYDCYRRECEPSCGALNNPNICPKLSHVCFPGCYCPSGYVRKGNDCILPINCGDCECNVLPHLEYVTYDEKNFTVNGNCTYIMSQDILNKKHNNHKFQVLITNRHCKDKKERMCVGKVTVLYKNHNIQVKRDLPHGSLKLIIDSEHIFDISEPKEWLDVKQTSTKHLRILLKEIQVLVSVYYPSLGVSIKAPSLKFGGKLEGLCGDCNGNPNDDLRLMDNQITSNINDFVLDWAYGTPEDKAHCAVMPQEECIEVPPECLRLEDITKYGQCHPVLDPSMFIDWCKKDTCNSYPELSCGALEAYSRECANLGFCIDWHNNLCPAQECPADQEFRPCAPACSQTCEALKDARRKCTNPPIEGCFCPEGRVFWNNTCVVEERCEACDEEGHHSGDVWKKDACTTCSCEGMNVQCETQTCPSIETVCEEGYTAQKIPVQDECCDKYKCVHTPIINATCVPPLDIQCNEGQVSKLIRKDDGCQRFVCECKPIEECEPIGTITPPTEPYIERKVNTSGCCPVIVEICLEEFCPEVTCPQFYSHEKLVVPGKCCPEYICLPPKNTCVVELKYIDDENGGERPRKESEKEQVLKKINETWQDGPCRKCECIMESNGEYHDHCITNECPDPTKSTDYQDYVLEARPEVGKCCPSIHRAACKHDGKIYEPGKKSQLEEDPCASIECIRDSTGRLLKITETQSCETNCEDMGWEYTPPEPDSKECCGSCKPVACVVDDDIYDIGETWISEDYCTNYTCTVKNGSLLVLSEKTKCPPIPSNLINDYIVVLIPEEGKCCGTYRPTDCVVGLTIYKVGESWPTPDNNKCKKISCIENEFGDVSKQESVETCMTDCAQGWEYKESDTECCGECVPVGCVVDGKLKQIGENWTSSDNCTTNTCEQLGDQLVVLSEQEVCPNLDKCLPEFIYTDGCCKRCNVTAEALGLCKPEEIAVASTIGLFSSRDFTHGLCKNKKGVEGFTKCDGLCKSYTSFNSASGLHDSICTCCQATKYEPFSVTLDCEGEHQIKTSFPKPIECGCQPCETKHHTKNPVKTEVKHKKRGARIYHGY